MANLTETSTFDAAVYRIDQNDPVQGWDGSNLNISNLQAAALANRTQWLKERVDLGARFTAIDNFAPGAPGASTGLVPDDMKGKLLRVSTATNNGAVVLPAASTCSENANIAITNEPAVGFQFISTNNRAVVINRSGSDTIIDIENANPATSYTVQPYSIVRVHKLNASTWMVWKEHAVEHCPQGMISAWAVAAQPIGWLECNGAAVSRTTYARLFANIGTSFGVGNGTTTFNLPDLRGEFIRGWDNGRGIDTGRTFGSAQADEFRSHVHELTAGSVNLQTSATPNTNDVGKVGVNAGMNTLSAGGAETRPRNIALMYCIKF